MRCKRSRYLISVNYFVICLEKILHLLQPLRYENIQSEPLVFYL